MFGPQLTCQFHNLIATSLFRSNTPVNAPAPTSHRRADTPAPGHRCANALLHLNHPVPPSLEPPNKQTPQHRTSAPSSHSVRHHQPPSLASPPHCHTTIFAT